MTLQPILDRNALRTADVVPGFYVKPEGDIGFHQVRLKEGGPVHFASSLAPGVTFRPGASIVLLRPEGRNELVVAGFPPPGRRGIAAPVRRVSRVEEASEDYLAFAYTGGSLYAWETDNTGAFTVDRNDLVASVGGSLPVLSAILIREDAGGFVGANSVAWYTAAKLYCYDPEGGVLHTYTVTTIQASHPIYSGGFLYWLENAASHTGGTTTWNLRRSRCDFSSPTTVDTREVTVVTSVPDWDASPVATWNTGSSIHVVRHWTDPDEGGDEGVRFAFAGGDSEETDLSEVELSTTPPLCVPGSGVVVGALSTGKLQQHPAALSGAWTDTWQDETAWKVTSARSSGTSADGADGILYGKRGTLGGTYHLIRGTIGASSGDPDVTFEVANHATAGEPDWMFSKG